MLSFSIRERAGKLLLIACPTSLMCSVYIDGRKSSTLKLSKDHGVRQKMNLFASLSPRMELEGGLKLQKTCLDELESSVESAGTIILTL